MHLKYIKSTKYESGHVMFFCCKSGGGKFTEHDEAALSAFCSHIAVQFFPDEQSFESILAFVRNQMTLPEGVLF